MRTLQNNRFSKRNVVKQILFLGICSVLLVHAMNFVGEGRKVVGISMESTFLEGESLFIDKFSYRFSDPKRFDVVVFPFEEETGTVMYIKRVIGLPGETVQIAGDTIYINGEILEESYGKEAMEEGSEGIVLNPYVLKEDEYFVLGDNRNFSVDSRNYHVGPIKRESIIGKTAFRLWSLDE